MNRPTDDRLLAFLEGAMEDPERQALLDALDDDPELAEQLRAAAVGLDAMRSHAGSAAVSRTGATRPRISPWWLAVAAAAALALAVPSTWWVARSTAQPPPLAATGRPESPEPTFVLVLHGRWPDAGSVDAEQAQARAREYWQWTSDLAEQGMLVAAGDLAWEPGERLGPEGAPLLVAADELERPDYLVGMFALRVGSYEEALAVARQCPHLRYGGSVSVRQVGAGFVTVPGEGDWSE